MEKVIRTYVEKLYCGSVNEIFTEEVEDRDPTKVKTDNLMEGFCFYDRECTFDEEKGEILGKSFNRSKFIYCGERISLEAMKKACEKDSQYDYFKKIIRTMEMNGNKYACYTQGGCLHIMKKGEMTYNELITKKEEQKKLNKKRNRKQ